MVLELVRKDKLREVRVGYDGIWVVYLGFILICMDVFIGYKGNNLCIYRLYG